MITVVDYGMGNLRSVEKAFLHSGVEVKVSSESKDVHNADAIVVPGVGAFKDCITNLHGFGLTEAVLKSIRAGKPFLGICMGLQILFSESEEFGHSAGLDVFKGNVPRFPDMGLKVPHMGWNTVRIKRRPPIFEGVPDNSYFYFVHSYYVNPEDEGIVSATTDYGIEFTSMVWKDNVFATQFHPEKSQALGLSVLKNFADFAHKN